MELPNRIITKEMTDKELRLWICDRVMSFHKSETDTKRLEQDMLLMYRFIMNDSKSIPDKISYV